MIRFENITLGSDMEFFVIGRDGKIVSAEGYIPGTKENPEQIPGLPDGFCTQLDNVAAEGNIPALVCQEGRNLANAAAFKMLTQTLYNGMNAVLKRRGGALHQLIDATAGISTYRFTDEELSTENAQRFGCDPSWSAWTGEKILVDPSRMGKRRTIGFHVHIGYKHPSIEANYVLGRALDLFLGTTSTIVYGDKERKSLGYGVAGDMRHKPYGMEYRVLPGPACFDAHRVAVIVLSTIDKVNAFFAAHPNTKPGAFLADYTDLISDHVMGNSRDSATLKKLKATLDGGTPLIDTEWQLRNRPQRRQRVLGAGGVE